MSSLNEFLAQKKAALAKQRDRLRTTPGATAISATVTAEGRSGVRRIRIRDFQLLSDSPPDFAGYNLGPSSPELQLGVLGSCLTHTFEIQAADLGVPLDALEVTVEAEIDGRGNLLGDPAIPVYPQNLRYRVKITSPAAPETIEQLRQAVDRSCPILNLLRQPQQISVTIDHQHQPA